MSSFNHLLFKRVCLLLFSLLFISPEVAFCQDNDVTECPYFNVFSSDTNGVSFALLSTNVEATISGVIANVVVEQTYLNEGDSTLDATYVFPMSSKAAIYGMQMIIDDRTLVAEIRRKAEAQEIFENANEEGLTAALLEQNRPNVFQMSIANIASGDSIKVRMVYTELLVPNSGVYQFVFPNIVGPRYTTNGEPWVYQTIIDSLSTSETSLDINLKIIAGMPLSALFIAPL
jgi:Ca-activated chloride channel family protein